MNILIFGADINDTNHWIKNLDNFYNSIDFFGNNAVNHINGNTYKLDFNIPQNLQQLPDNYYQTIMFTWSTAKFILWSSVHLNILTKKLVSNGTLYLPFEFNGFIIENNISTNLNNYIYPISNNLAIGNGIYASLSITICNHNNRQKILDEYYKEKIHPYNQKILEKYFSYVVLLSDGTYPSLPLAHFKQLENCTYYFIQK